MIREVEDIVLQIIDQVLPKKNNRGRKPKHCNLFYLRKIIYVQQSDIKWKYLELMYIIVQFIRYSVNGLHLMYSKLLTKQ